MVVEYLRIILLSTHYKENGSHLSEFEVNMSRVCDVERVTVKHKKHYLTSAFNFFKAIKHPIDFTS